VNKKIVCPLISPSLVIADDARLAARISCALVKPGYYLPVVDGPPMSRSDHDAEVVRRNNAAARANPDTIFLTGLSDISVNAITARFSPRLQSKIRRVSTFEDIDRLYATNRRAGPPLAWGRDRIGIGLLRALRAGVSIVFEDRPSPVDLVLSKGTHLVVCEEGNDIAQRLCQGNRGSEITSRLACRDG
jgi:hypothetical protein